MSSVTQNDIARLAGVSQRAVATVVGCADSKHGARVSEKTRQRILKAAKELNYRPQRQAQLMRGVKSHAIGYVKDMSLQQPMVELAFQTASSVHRTGYTLVTHELLWSRAQELDSIAHALLDAKVEGVLLGTALTLPALAKAKIPVMGVGRVGAEGQPFIAADEKQGVASLVRHLVANGRRKLAMEVKLLEGEKEIPSNWDNWQRLAGFQEACDAMGIPRCDTHIIWQPNRNASFDYYDPGRQTASQLMRSSFRADALICANDYRAIGAMKYLLDHGVDIPNELALCGFENTAAGLHAMIPLTTVAFPIVEIAETGVDLLLKRVRGEIAQATQPVSTLIPCSLIVRDSTKLSSRKSFKSRSRSSLRADESSITKQDTPRT